MAILYDFHVHSSFSGDSDTPMEDMLLAAIHKNLHGLCMTEHLDLDYPVSVDCPPGYFSLDLSSYRQVFEQLQGKYGDKLDLCFGIELGVQPHLADKHYELVRQYPFDFVLASAHTCHHRDPYYPEFYQDRSEEAAYREYFSCILENLEAYNGFDSFAHLDYVVRYGPNRDTFYNYETYRDLLDNILVKLISMGKALECNTGAINYGLKSLNPSIEVLKRYRELGGEYVTIGSDAHKTPALAYGFDIAKEVLLASGFTHYTTFKNRVPRMHKL